MRRPAEKEAEEKQIRWPMERIHTGALNLGELAGAPERSCVCLKLPTAAAERSCANKVTSSQRQPASRRARYILRYVR